MLADTGFEGLEIEGAVCTYDTRQNRAVPDPADLVTDFADILIPDERYVLGQSLMDEEHAKLVNGMRDLLKADSTRDAQSAIHTFVKLWRDHCDDEETLMEQVKFPRIAEHRENHRLFDGMLLFHLDSYLMSSKWGSREMAEFCTRWFLGHLQAYDAPLANYIKQRELQDSPAGARA